MKLFFLILGTEAAGSMLLVRERVWIEEIVVEMDELIDVVS